MVIQTEFLKNLRKSLILEINTNNSDDFKALLYKETKNNQKMIETIVNNKNKIEIEKLSCENVLNMRNLLKIQNMS